MDLKLKGKRALVSGSTAGIGRAIATSLAKEGARVIINGRKESDVTQAVAELKEATGGEVIGFVGDLSLASAAEELAKRHPYVEILVNNLATFEVKPFEEISDADWLRTFDVNVISGIRLSRSFLPAMMRANWGRIIFISSESAIQVPAEIIHYGASKAAQIAAARGLAETLKGTGITVNSILPGPTKSRAMGQFIDTMAEAQGVTSQDVEEEFFKNVRPSSILQRFASSEEVASLVAYIASPLSSATTGAPLRVDGGVLTSAF